jgi:hypothetical protein
MLTVLIMAMRSSSVVINYVVLYSALLTRNSARVRQGPHATKTSVLAAAVRRGYVYSCVALMIQVMSVCLWLLT